MWLPIQILGAMVAFGGFDCWLHHLITKREIDSLIDSTDNPQFTYLSIYDIYFQFQTMVSQMVWERTSSMVFVNRCSPLREVWRHVTKLAKFLDLNNRSWDWDGQLHRRTIEEKYRLRFCSLLQSCTENSYMSIFSCFFLPNLQDHSLLRSRSVLPLQRDVMPGGVLPYITYTGMCRPTGSWFWSSWFRTGYPFHRRFLERGITFRTHESTSFVSSHLKLLKDRLLLKIRFSALTSRLLYSCCTLERSIKKLAHS